jgi:hypothetical protein
MSLHAREQRALDGIEITLQADEARLASMFAFFTYLCRDEAKPVIEDLGTPSRRPRGSRRAGARVRAGGRGRPTVLFPIVIVIVITIGIVTPAVLVSLTGGGSHGCPPATAAHISGPAVSQARSCQSSQPAP